MYNQEGVNLDQGYFTKVGLRTWQDLRQGPQGPEVPVGTFNKASLGRWPEAAFPQAAQTWLQQRALSQALRDSQRRGPCPL